MKSSQDWVPVMLEATSAVCSTGNTAAWAGSTTTLAYHFIVLFDSEVDSEATAHRAVTLQAAFNSHVCRFSTAMTMVTVQVVEEGRPLAG